MCATSQVAHILARLKDYLSEKKKTTLNLIKVCSIQKSVPRNRGVTITPAGKDYSMSAVKLLLICIAVVITNI